MATVTSRSTGFEMDSDELAVLVLESAQSPLVLWGDERQPLIFNAATAAVFGYSAEEFGSLQLFDLVHPDEQDDVRRQMLARNAGNVEVQRFRRRMLTKQGRVLHMDCMSTAIPLSGGRLGVMVDYRDVTEQVEADLQRRQQEALYRSIFDHAEIAIFTTDAEHRLATANPMALEGFGVTAEALRRIRPLSLVHREYRRPIMDWMVREAAHEESGGEFEVPVRVANAEYRWFAVDLNPIHNSDGEFGGLHGFLRDITTERRERQRLQSEAQTDPLTGLANRRQFDEVLASEFRRATREQTELSLLMLDLDHFKQMNDRYGHPAGDAVLKQAAKALTRVARRTDLVARYGGEEFAMILAETDRSGAAAAAERCLVAVRETALRWRAEDLRVTISIGVSTLQPMAHQSPEALVSSADAALYAAKQAGRDRAAFGQEHEEQGAA